ANARSAACGALPGRHHGTRGGRHGSVRSHGRGLPANLKARGDGDAFSRRLGATATTGNRYLSQVSSPRHLYVHVPFCARRCSYCDFSIAVRREVPVREYVDAITTELEMRAPESGLQLDTLYFGGGTPSRLGGEGVRELLEVLARHT